MNRSLSKLLISGVIIAGVLTSCISGPWLPRNSTKPMQEKRERCDRWVTQPQMIQLPVFNQAWHIVSDCDQYAGEAVSIAMLAFYREWHVTFGDVTGKVWKALDTVMIEWSPRDRNITAHNMAGTLQRNAPLSGVVLSPGMIWVRPSVNGPICETSLIHELVHIAIWSLKGTDGDPDHLGSKYWGWTVDHTALIQRVNEQLCELGI
tara:strand:- start:1282 stop:1899 length:618 start_codon:yes stop_codon:yes gene_type:complete